ncbi:MAG: M6 family metalloprotease domain-containing protein [Gemmatimonadales bacterium]
MNARSPGAATAVAGNYFIPVVLVQYKNRSGPFPASSYQNILFNPTPTTEPYSVKSYYEQLSNGLITLDGVVFDWTPADSNDAYYEDGCDGIGIDPMGNAKTCAHPLSPSGVSSRFRDLLIEAITALDDGSVDWSQFDGDGDGFVDFVTFIQPEVDGACGTTNIWAHRYHLTGLGLSPYQTKTPRPGGGFYQINDYTFQSGLGGPTGCGGAQVMPVGTVVHETGHAFGLPDLYDTSGATQGIGEWGLMGSANYARPYSPGRMSAWSLTELGWVNVDTLTASRTVTLNPIQSSDTVLYVGTPVAGEYFLLENRDSLEADTAQMNTAFGSRKKNPGLLIWHIDQSRINAGLAGGGNSVNQGTIQGVALMQADGLNQLRTPGGGNRGDAGDSYPGSTVNRAFTWNTTPRSATNQNAYAGFAVDSIFRNNMGTNNPSPVVFRFLKRERSLFAGTRTGSFVKVNNVSTTRFEDVVAPGDMVDLDVTSPQLAQGGRSQFTFVSWSDNGASAHSIISDATKPDTVLADFTANHKVNLVTTPNGGTVSSDIPGNPNLVQGAFVQEGMPVTLTATAFQGGTFVRWQGDTNTTNATLVLPMMKPYSLTPVFSANVTVNADDAASSLLGASCTAVPCLTTQQLTYLDQTGNNDGVYNLGDFLAYADRNGLNPSSPAMQRVLAGPTVSIPVPAAEPRKER